MLASFLPELEVVLQTKGSTALCRLLTYKKQRQRTTWACKSQSMLAWTQVNFTHCKSDTVGRRGGGGYDPHLTPCLRNNSFSHYHYWMHWPCILGRWNEFIRQSIPVRVSYYLSFYFILFTLSLFFPFSLHPPFRFLSQIPPYLCFTLPHPQVGYLPLHRHNHSALLFFF